jgi:hypothetical protein
MIRAMQRTQTQTHTHTHTHTHTLSGAETKLISFERLLMPLVVFLGVKQMVRI